MSAAAQMELALGRKNEKLSQVIDNAGKHWQTLARLVVRTMDGKQVTGEDIRLKCCELEIVPHDPHAWGAFVNLLLKEGRLIPTGRYVAMRGERSNARRTPVYLVRAHP